MWYPSLQPPGQDISATGTSMLARTRWLAALLALAAADALQIHQHPGLPALRPVRAPCSRTDLGMRFVCACERRDPRFALTGPASCRRASPTSGRARSTSPCEAVPGAHPRSVVVRVRVRVLTGAALCGCLTSRDWHRSALSPESLGAVAHTDPTALQAVKAVDLTSLGVDDEELEKLKNEEPGFFAHLFDPLVTGCAMRVRARDRVIAWQCGAHCGARVPLILNV